MIRLPSVTTGRIARFPRRRIALAGATLVLGALAVGAARPEAAPGTFVAPLARELGDSSTALRLPYAWLAAAPPRLLPADRVDVIAVRTTDRAVLDAVLDARVLEVEGDGLVLEVTADDATNLAAARASSYLLLLLLRPAR